MEGILAQIKDQNTYIPGNLTLEDIKKAFETLDSIPRVERVLELPIYYALSLPDKEFIQFMKSDSSIRLIGGMEAYTKLQERMKLHNLFMENGEVKSLIDTVVP